MVAIEVEIVRAKLSLIQGNLEALDPIRSMKREDYLRDLYRRKATERLLQELIEAAIDINVHLIVESGHPPPEDYYQSFIRAGELGILSFDLAEKLAPSAGLRNRLVHEYDRIDHAIILKAVAQAEELYPRYLKEVHSFISRTAET